MKLRDFLFVLACGLCAISALLALLSLHERYKHDPCVVKSFDSAELALAVEAGCHRIFVDPEYGSPMALKVEPKGAMHPTDDAGEWSGSLPDRLPRAPWTKDFEDLGAAGACPVEPGYVEQPTLTVPFGYGAGTKMKHAPTSEPPKLPELPNFSPQLPSPITDGDRIAI